MPLLQVGAAAADFQVSSPFDRLDRIRLDQGQADSSVPRAFEAAIESDRAPVDREQNERVAQLDSRSTARLAVVCPAHTADFLRLELSGGFYVNRGLDRQFVAGTTGHHSHLLHLHSPNVRCRIPVGQIARFQVERNILLGPGLDPHPLEPLQLQLRALDLRAQMPHVELHNLIPGPLSRVLHLHRRLHCSLGRHLGRAQLHSLVCKARIAKPVAEGIERLVFAVEIRPPVQQVVIQNGQQLRIARGPRLRQSTGR